MTGEQLVLALDHAPALSREDFLIGPGNRDALATILGWPTWQTPFVLLEGPAGSGKTHLVEIWRARSDARIIPATELTELTGEDLTLAEAVAVEDIDRVEGRDAALFHLLNRARERGATVLLTARDGAKVRSAALPDLASRLRAAQPLTLTAPDDDLLARVMIKLFADRQLVVAPALVAQLLNRSERTFAAAAVLVRRLDEAALAAGRPISRQMASRILGEEFALSEFEEE